MTEAEPWVPVFAISDAKNNGELIAECVKLKYLAPEWPTLDPTYGEGRFWSEFRPDDLTASDLNPAKSPIGRSVDFRPAMSGYAPKSFRAIVIDPPYKLCLDAETQVLTRRGWLSYDAVLVGDEAYSRDPETGVGCWRTITAVNVYPRSATEVMVCAGKNLDFVATPDHRWPVLDRSGRPAWRTTETLQANDRIVSAAPWADTPTVAKYDDAFVELVAWFWTEGDMQPGTTYGKITQSHVVNPAYCARIADAFSRLYGAPVETFERTGRRCRDAAWRTKVEGHNTRFIFSAVIGRMLAEVAPAKVPTREFIESLTTAQRELFINTSTDADGQSATRLAQKDPARSEAFAYACILSGRAVSIFTRNDGNGTTVTMKQAVARPHRPGVTREVRDTLVWCPTVAGTATWLARRNGTLYFTGNSGTSTGEGPSASDESYGVENWASADDRHELMRLMLTEGRRLVIPARTPVPGTRRHELVGGYILFKCQDQVNSGRVHWQTRMMADHGEKLGMNLVDMLHFISYRGQPEKCVSCKHTRKSHPDDGPCTKIVKGVACDCAEFVLDTSQQHARRNYSSLLVFRLEREPEPVAVGPTTLFP